MRKIRLPKSKRIAGLYIYCNCCHSFYSDDSKIKPNCIALKYKAKIHVPGTRNECRTEILNAKNYKDAIRKFYQYKEFLIKNGFSSNKSKKEFGQPKVEIQNIDKPILLIEAFANYLAYLNNVGVVEFKKKERGQEHLKQVERSFRYYQHSIDSNGVDSSKVKFEEVTEREVSFLHNHLIFEREYSGKTYNNMIALLRQFTDFIIKRYYLSYSNPFNGIPRMEENESDPLYVEEEDFKRMLELTTFENGHYIKPNKKRVEKRNYYRPWLKHAFWLGLLTGVRIDEFVKLKWNEIHYDKENKMTKFKVNHQKISRQKSNKLVPGAKITKTIVITDELQDLLFDMGHEQYKGLDLYVLGPHELISRDSTMPEHISKSFTHYYKLLNNGQVRNLKHLRKTYITSAYDQFGDNAIILSNHADTDVVKKHYLAKSMLQKAKTDFKVFKKR